MEAVSALCIALSPPFGAAVAVLAYGLPMAMSPILIGRLCGVFVAGERQIDLEAESSPGVLLAGGDATAAAAGAPSSFEQLKLM
jgi:hypothetical protein